MWVCTVHTVHINFHHITIHIAVLVAMSSSLSWTVNFVQVQWKAASRGRSRHGGWDSTSLIQSNPRHTYNIVTKHCSALQSLNFMNLHLFVKYDFTLKTLQLKWPQQQDQRERGRRTLAIRPWNWKRYWWWRWWWLCWRWWWQLWQETSKYWCTNIKVWYSQSIYLKITVLNVKSRSSTSTAI